MIGKSNDSRWIARGFEDVSEYVRDVVFAADEC